MNRYIIVFIAALIVVGTTTGFILYFRSLTSASPADNTIPITSYPADNTPAVTVPAEQNSIAAVQSAYQNELAKHPSDNTKLYQTVIVGGYALQVWAGTIMGGEAILKYDQTQGRWVLLDGGGGAWSIDVLTAIGVPHDIAAALLAGISH
jgi:hypothetical protein